MMVCLLVVTSCCARDAQELRFCLSILGLGPYVNDCWAVQLRSSCVDAEMLSLCITTVRLRVDTAAGAACLRVIVITIGCARGDACLSTWLV